MSCYFLVLLFSFFFSIFIFFSPHFKSFIFLFHFSSFLMYFLLSPFFFPILFSSALHFCFCLSICFPPPALCTSVILLLMNALRYLQIVNGSCEKLLSELQVATKRRTVDLSITRQECRSAKWRIHEWDWHDHVQPVAFPPQQFVPVDLQRPLGICCRIHAHCRYCGNDL